MVQVLQRETLCIYICIGIHEGSSSRLCRAQRQEEVGVNVAHSSQQNGIWRYTMPYLQQGYQAMTLPRGVRVQGLKEAGYPNLQI